MGNAGNHTREILSLIPGTQTVKLGQRGGIDPYVWES